MRSLILSHAGHSTGPSNSAVRYAPFCAGTASSSMQTGNLPAEEPIAQAGSIGNIMVRFPVAITQGSYEVALMVNNVAVLTGTITTGTDLTIAGTADVSAGNMVCWRFTPSGTPNAQTFIQIGCTFDATVSGKGVLFSHVAAGTSAGYSQMGGFTADGSTDGATRCPMPTAGVIDAMYIRVSAAPGTGNARTFTLYKNGSATALTVTVSDGAFSGSMASGGNVSFAAGDTINVRQELTGSPSSAAAGIGVDWTPTISGETVLFSGFTGTQSNAAARIANLRGRSGTSTSTASDAYNLVPVDCTLRKLYAQTNVAPGGAASRTVQVQIAGSTQANPAAVISGANTDANDTTHDLAVTAGALVSLINTPSGSPAANNTMGMGVVAFIDPPAAAAANSNLLLRGVG